MCAVCDISIYLHTYIHTYIHMYDYDIHVSGWNHQCRGEEYQVGMKGAGLLPVVDALVFQYRAEVAGAGFGLVSVLQ